MHFNLSITETGVLNQGTTLLGNSNLKHRKLDCKPNYSAYYLEPDYKTITEFAANIMQTFDKKQVQNSQLKIK